MAKRDADPIQAANAAWRVAMRDADYAAWYRQRLRTLIEVCEFDRRREELRKILEDIDQKGGGDETGESGGKGDKDILRPRI